MKLRNFQCLWCERFHGREAIPTCDAFPKGIPSELWLGKVAHDKPIKWDKELLFKPVEEIIRK